MILRLALLASLLAGALAQAEDFQGSTQEMPYEDGVIHYSKQAPADPVAKLKERVESGETKLPWDEKFGYLPGLLELLKVPASSQTLVFSKTSLQRHEISPSNPRALYYRDDVYIGYIPEAERLEIAATDPKLGAIFYTLEQDKVRKPKLVRETDCLRCHGGQRSLGVPGPIMRSIGTDSTGELAPLTEVSDIDHCTPFADRWAGWYVTGQHGAQTHRGNLIGAKAFARQESEPNYLGNLTDLHQFVEPGKYLRPGSDIGALMVLEHQAHMHAYITRLNFETQQMMSMYGHVRYLHSQENAFLRYLLFTEESPLTAPIQGDPDFAKTFQDQGPRDHLGRSLRDFDLKTRMFKYPCSFLIYSEAFDSMPTVMRDLLLERLYAILTNRDPDPQFAKIAAADRQAILEILRETKPNLPAYWRQTSG